VLLTPFVGENGDTRPVKTPVFESDRTTEITLPLIAFLAGAMGAMEHCEPTTLRFARVVMYCSHNILLFVGELPQFALAARLFYLAVVAEFC
jgi:hypothetical protein